jgi:hypothetical protein
LQDRLTLDDALFNSAFEQYGDELDPGTEIERMLNAAAANEAFEARLQIRNRKICLNVQDLFRLLLKNQNLIEVDGMVQLIHYDAFFARHRMHHQQQNAEKCDGLAGIQQTAAGGIHKTLGR